MTNPAMVTLRPVAMTGTFACPECGAQVHPRGHSAGRQVRCQTCDTLVEVPFLPRVLPRRGRRSRWSRAQVVSVGVALSLVVVSGVLGLTFRWFRARNEASHRSAVHAHVVAMEQAEASGDLSRALAEAESGLALAQATGVQPTERLVAHRDELARRLVAARLDSIAGMGPSDALSALIQVRDRARNDPALGDLLGEITERLAEAGTRCARSDLALADKAMSAQRAAEAFDALRHAWEIVELHVPDLRASSPLRERILSQAARLSAGFGVRFEPIQGAYYVGRASDYEEGLVARVLERTLARGFLPPPADSPWATIWEDNAPDRVTILVKETPVPFAPSSALNATQVDATFTWTRSGRQLWQGRAVSRTRMPPPTLPAYLATRYATATKRDPDAERQLLADALETALSRLLPQLQSLPSPPGVATTAP